MGQSLVSTETQVCDQIFLQCLLPQAMHIPGLLQHNECTQMEVDP